MFSIRTKLSYCKVFHRRFISNKNEDNANNYELACLFMFVNVRSG